MSKPIVKLKYDGEITFDKIEFLLTLFNQKMPDTKSPVCKTRLFSIMVECLENAYRHNYCCPDENPQIKVELIQDNDNYTLSIGNQIGNSELLLFTKRIDYLNTLSFTEIKKLYSETIREAHISEKGGAGIGLLKILRSTNQPLKYEVTEIDTKRSFITLIINIADN